MSLRVVRATSRRVAIVRLCRRVLAWAEGTKLEPDALLFVGITRDASGGSTVDVHWEGDADDLRILGMLDRARALVGRRFEAVVGDPLPDPGEED